jgi:hypothetical protein
VSDFSLPCAFRYPTNSLANVPRNAGHHSSVVSGVIVLFRMPLRALATAGLALVLVACATGSPGSPVTARTPGAPASQQATKATSRHGIYAKPLLDPQVAVTPTGVYVAWQVPPPGNAEHSVLARINATTGRIEATRRLGAAFGQAVAAGGVLWVALLTAAGRTLLRLDPRTLSLTGRWRIGSSADGGYFGRQMLAVTGSWLWVSEGTRLVRLFIPTARVTASVPLAGAASANVSANPAGTTLIVGESDSGGRGAVQRRNPVTGAILVSHPVFGVAAPLVAGPEGSFVWVSEPTGNMGYIQRLDAATLTGTRCQEGGTPGTCVQGSNDIEARVADGLLWVSQQAGGDLRNYCGDPATGRILAPIGLPQPDQDDILAIGSHAIFYAAPALRASQYLRLAPIPAACFTH